MPLERDVVSDETKPPAKPGTTPPISSTPFTIYVADNFHYMDESERPT